MSIKHITSENFESEVLKSEESILMDFWAEWCGPCKMLAPILDQIADEYKGRVQIAKLDVEASQNIAMQFGVRSIPTLILFKGGEVAATKIGALPKGQLTNWLESVL